MSQAANPVPTSGWSIVGQTPKTGQNSQGIYVPGIQISFVTGSGQPGNVWVPDTDYNLDTVRALVMAKVATIDAIQGLSG